MFLVTLSKIRWVNILFLLFYSFDLHACFCASAKLIFVVVVVFSFSFVYNLKIGIVIAPGLFLLVEITLNLFGFHINFKITFSSSVRNAVCILIGSSVNLCISFGSITILTTILALPSMNRGYLSSFWCPLPSPFSEYCVFLYEGLLLPLCA